jgi:hypothetical protein
MLVHTDLHQRHELPHIPQVACESCVFIIKKMSFVTMEII